MFLVLVGVVYELGDVVDPSGAFLVICGGKSGKVYAASQASLVPWTMFKSEDSPPRLAFLTRAFVVLRYLAHGR
jgi:hypothetical protein